MNAKPLTVNVSDALKVTTLTVKVSGLRRLKLRTRIGLALLGLAARIIGVGNLLIQHGDTTTS